LAVAASAFDFHGFTRYAETQSLGAVGNPARERRVREFGNRAAGGANQELADVPFARFAAAHKGIERGDAMNEARVLQEVEGAVDGGRRGLFALLPQQGQQLVGLDRFMAAPYELQHPAAERR